MILNDKEFQLYGGPKMEPLNCFQHEGLQKIAFSPDEKYILSFNGDLHYAPTSENFIVWKTESGLKLRSFRAEKEEGWNSFCFSPCSGYLSRGCSNKIKVYELPSLVLAEDGAGNKLVIDVPDLKYYRWLSN